jgi:ComF family protein
LEADVAVSVRQWLAELFAMVFPSRCGSCQLVLPAGEAGLCPQCAGDLLGLIDRPYCGLCGQDVGPYALRPADGAAGESAKGSRSAVRAAGLKVCGQCDEGTYRYAGLVRVGPYIPPLDRMIRQFKYHGGHFLASRLGQWQAASLAGQSWLEDVDALAPVPLHWRRRLGRGFNQSQMLADEVGGQVDRPVVSVLDRPVSRPAQASLPKSKRFENVRGVFAVRKAKQVRGRSFCLIDDVCTTGATLSEAARTLLAAGARSVYACVVAVAQPPVPFAQPPTDSQ